MSDDIHSPKRAENGTGRISRRRVLQAGAATVGAVTVAGVASGQAPPARTGGEGFLTVDDFRKPPADDRTFVVNGSSPFVLDHSAGCSGDPSVPVKRYQGYEIEYQGPTGLKLATLFLEPERAVQTGVVLDFQSHVPCPPDPVVIDTRTGNPLSGAFPVLKVSFRPV